MRSGAQRDSLYIDTIAQMMAVHLARRQLRAITSRALSRRRPWSPISGCRQLLDIIEANLDQPLTLDAMAAHILASAPCIWPAPVGPHYRTIAPVAPGVLAHHNSRAKELLRKCRNAYHRRCAVGGIFVTEPPLALDDSAHRDNPRRLSTERMRRVSIEERAGNLAETLHK